MTTHYDDKILENTSEWISTNELVRCVIGDKTGIINAIHELESMEYLESRKIRNTIEYRRKDTTGTNVAFNHLIRVFQMNQDIEFEEIKKLTSLTTKSGKLSKRAKDLLVHIESEVDSAYKIIIRLKYQEKLRLIPHRTTEKRVVQLESFITKIMKTINTKYQKDIKLIQEFFQNHSKQWRFKI